MDNGIIGSKEGSKEPLIQQALNHWLITKGVYDGVPQKEVLDHFRKYKASLSSRVDKKDEKNYPG